MQEQVVGRSLDECTGDDWMIRLLSDLRPPTATDAQIVLCKLPEAPTLGDPTKLGLCAVTEVFRGARFKSTRKGSGESSRRMGQNRPACSSVRFASVAAVRLVPLTKVTDHQWAAAGITIPWTVDPLKNVVAEVRYEVQQWLPDRFVVRATPAVIAAIEAAMEDPDKFVAKASDGKETVAELLKMWSLQDFGPTVQGGKNITIFLQSLPKAYSSGGLSFPAEEIAWQSTCLRAPDYFQLVNQTASSKTYSRSVLTKLSSLMPPASEKEKSVAAVVAFVKAVDALAAPVLSIG